ncbi:unnamed protein product [Vitrella brassicaformis CCMP3155]|uniref:Sugar fermentation stimulation protein C-terminal domain-containing protein n=1 Tax=Vitrella brassicaformis (strain CCMP3155) TaxID=1169540 RepID=A0A0G4G769_VITBC|nr:unnamed protein product [Vitrella brassicaformis CCMP3155]|eukprot:CEM24472.1 unnamed protein product [Vitrella brassicaformis CCMP3155]
MMAAPAVVYRQPLIAGRIVRRYKRFMADVRLDEDGREVCCHLANPGSMMGMIHKGAPVRLRDHWAEDVSSSWAAADGEGPKRKASKRKLQYSLEAIRIGGTWIGCNTLLPNELVKSMLQRRQLPEVMGILPYDNVKAEVRLPESSNSRFDFLLTRQGADSSSSGGAGAGPRKLVIEVKMVTMGSNWWSVEMQTEGCTDPPRPWASLKPTTTTTTDNDNAADGGGAGAATQQQGEPSCDAPPKPNKTTKRSKKEHAMLEFVKTPPDECRAYTEREGSGQEGHQPLVALFPDSKTERGQKHVAELMKLSRRGGQGAGAGEDTSAEGALGDCGSFDASLHCDPAYHALLHEAATLPNLHILPYSFEYVFDDPDDAHIVYRGPVPFRGGV